MELKTIFIILIAVTLISGAIKSFKFLQDKERKQIFKDPLYLIIIGIEVALTIVSAFLYFPLAFLGLAVILITHGLLIKLTDKNYDLERDAKNTFKLMKKCPNCMKSLPSYATVKCPYCTSDL
jgi:hypothetical protein